jgi:hypothetical protein
MSNEAQFLDVLKRAGGSLCDDCRRTSLLSATCRWRPTASPPSPRLQR